MKIAFFAEAEQNNVKLTNHPKVNVKGFFGSIPSIISSSNAKI